MEKKLTINDIAKLAGVGKSTVSRYFNGGYVKEETREKISKIVMKHNYQPNKIAQNLKSKKSNIIGLIVPTISSRTMARTVESVEKYLNEFGYTTIIINTSHDAYTEVDSILNLYHMQVEGIILFATSFTSKHYEIINTLPIPVVSVGQANEHGTSVINADYEAGYEVGNLVGDKGYKNIVYIGVEDEDIAVGRLRKQGVFDGLQKHAIDQLVYMQSDFTYDTTRTVMRNLIGNEKFDMIICATDNMAMAAYKELQLAGIKIPDEVAVVAFGGYEISQLLHPSLQTVRFNNENMGTIAAKNIIELINQKKVQKLTIIDYILIEGHSL